DREITQGDPVGEDCECRCTSAAEISAVELLGTSGKIIGEDHVRRVSGLPAQGEAFRHARPDPHALPIGAGGHDHFDRVWAAPGSTDGRTDARHVTGSVQGDAYPPADPLRAGEGPGVVWHQRFELIDRIGGVVVMVRWLERRSGIVRASGDPRETVPARIDPGRVVLRDDRVLTVFVPAGLD